MERAVFRETGRGLSSGHGRRHRRPGRPERGLGGGHLWLLAGLLGLLPALQPASAQVLDAAWDGRQQAAGFFQASLEKERRPPDWPGAVRELEKCIEVSPEPSWEASIQDGSGRWRRHYLPYYYLGRAWWGQGDCEQAVKWLSTSLAKGEVCKSKQGDTRELEKLLVKCEQKGIAPSQAARDLVRSECSKVQTAWLDGGTVVALDRLLRQEWWRPLRLDEWTDFEAK